MHEETLKERRERLSLEAAEEKKIRDKITKLKRKVRSDITSCGYLSVKYKLDYIVANPGSEPKVGLTHDQVVTAFNEAINQYLKSN